MRWLARGEHEVPADDAWLAPAEAARLARYRFTKRRTEYRLRRWTGKQAVAAVAGLDTGVPGRLAAIEVLNRPTGAPYVQVDGAPLGVDVSLTDRAGWAVCLVGERAGEGNGYGRGVGAGVARVGVDLEIVEARSDAFVEDFLTAAERDHVRGLPGRPEQDAAANLFWSAKESALKVLRVGLRADTRSVEVHLTGPARADGWAPLEVRTTTDGVLPGWWRRDGVFVLTVTYDVPAEPPAVLPQTADLSQAVPVHSWMANPLS
jgi:4'-phosphopantetheinyl transferase